MDDEQAQAASMDGDDVDVLISAIEHYSYCPRQCALIHVDQTYDENLYTIRGKLMHERVDSGDDLPIRGVETLRGIPLWSERYGLRGKADVVELEPDGTPYPVEYKHGSRHKAAEIAACDDVQLAAQALCLEEMSGRPVNEGAIFYATSKRRRIVPITDALRTQEGDVWSGFSVDDVKSFMSQAGLAFRGELPIPSVFHPAGPDAEVPWHAWAAQKPT